MMNIPLMNSSPPTRRRPWYGATALMDSTKEYVNVPSSFTARHIRPSVTPAIHMDTAYSTTPIVEVQKWTSINLVLYMLSRL